jgi:hypothetical protein
MISQTMEKKLRKIVAAVGKSGGNSNMQRTAKEADAEALLFSLIDNLEKEVTGEDSGTAMLHSALERCFFRARVEKAKLLLETEEATA